MNSTTFTRRSFLAAERFPGRKLAWNRAAQAFDDPAANAYLGSAYRDGWRLDGLS